MSRIGKPGRQLRSLLFRAPVEEEVDAELSFHVEMLVRELVERGMAPDEARREAIRRVGDLPSVHATMLRTAKLRERDMRRTEYLDDLRQDVVHAFRQLAKAPGFTAVAVLTLALGIGATTAIFSAVESVALRAFPFAHADRTVYLSEWWRDGRSNFSVGNFVDMQAAAHSFDALGAVAFSSVNLAEGPQPERVLGALVSHRFFDVFGVRPALGRTFTAGEDEPGQEQVVVLSDQLWRDRLGGDRAVLGRTIRLNQRPFRVIGVMPPGFDPLLAKEQLWMPIAFTAAQRAQHDEHYLDVVGLLKPGVSREQAQAELDAIGRDLRQRFPKDDSERSLRVAPLVDFLIGEYRQRLFVLLGAVGFVLLISCGNVANLLLARGASRSKEIAIRSAIGAGRTRLMRQLLTESVVLATLSATVGLALAWALIRVIIASAPGEIPRLDQTRIDWGVLAFALGLAAVSSILFGFIPALRASRQDLQSTLREGGRGMGTARDAVRSALIIGEVALALTLLVGAGNLIRTAYELQQTKPGFDPSGLLMARVALPKASYSDPQRIAQIYDELALAMSREPGVVAAAVTSAAPLGPGGWSNGLVPEGKALGIENSVDANMRIVTPQIFATMRIPLVRGRLFTDRDRAGSERVMVISEALAKKLWPGEDAIGKRVACCEGEPDDPRWKTVIGVVGDVRSRGPMAEAYPEFYVPAGQAPADAWEWGARAMSIVARGRGDDASSLTASMRRVVRAMDATLPLYSITTMDDALAASMAEARFHTKLLGALGAIGLVLAALGIYSVIAYFVSVRTHEIGVRMALGATTRNVVGLMTWQGMRPVLVGVAIGAVGALAATRLLASSLQGVSATDPLTFAAVVALMVGVGVLASLVPARRATRVDPLVALRE